MYVLYAFTICVLAQHIGHYGQVLPGRSCAQRGAVFEDYTLAQAWRACETETGNGIEMDWE